MERIRIKNFRKIQGTWELDLAPITFFTGTNNSGKSSVLKAIMALDDFGESNNHLQLSFHNGKHSKKHKIDSYSNAVNWFNQDEKKLEIEFEFEHLGYQVSLSFTPHSWEDNKLIKGDVKHLFFERKRDGAKLTLERKSATEYQFFADASFFERRRRGEDLDEYNQHLHTKKAFSIEIKDLKAKKETVGETEMEYFSINQKISELNKKLRQVKTRIKELKKQKEKDDFVFSPSLLLEDLEGNDFSIDRIIRQTFSKYFRANEKEIGLSDNYQNYHRAMLLGDSLQEALSFRVEHLSPHRSNQVRLYMNENITNDIYSIINIHSQDPIPKGSKAGSFIKKWMERFEIGKDYRIKIIEGSASIIEVNEKGRWINLVDKGFGAGQVFSIILRIATSIHQNRVSKNVHFRRKRFTPIILIEEPEANLHPAFQAELADLFFDGFMNGIKFIIETHSEYILRKTQVLVNKQIEHVLPPKMLYEGEIEKNKLKIFGVYYFDKEGPYKMHFREDGKFKNDFGSGFFDEASNLAFDIL